MNKAIDIKIYPHSTIPLVWTWIKMFEKKRIKNQLPC